MIPARFTRRNAICRKPDERRSEQAKLQRKTSEEELNLKTAKRRLSTRSNQESSIVKEAVAVAGSMNSKPIMPTRYERQPSAQQSEEMGDELMSLSDLAGMMAQELESALERGGAFSRHLVVDEDKDTKKQESIDKISSVSTPVRRRSVISIMA
jgi:NTP pyrophosphatase (non-canonical NTP hydrolase)